MRGALFSKLNYATKRQKNRYPSGCRHRQGCNIWKELGGAAADEERGHKKTAEQQHFVDPKTFAL